MISISVGSDHAGFAYKEAIKKFLTEKGYTVLDAGTDSEASVDYPDYGRAAAELVANGTANAGIIVCGSGIGISIAANKVHGIRAANVTSVEMAKLARAHNNANMLAVGSRLSSLDDVLLMVAAFLETSFEGGRHAGRVAKLDAMG
ncbi:MAG: Ribose-5-phosphate isomerase B [Chlorobi bacterium]|jgi:ribose-5-phosphate isomerase (EC 5.3.1.6)|nr:MAG: ribose-5-phosphate isomerase B [Chlorobi bacterium OLB6]MBV6464153.1 Ribose-5-phosphate isomerase B [Chlorobiota bacterium]